MPSPSLRMSFTKPWLVAVPVATGDCASCDCPELYHVGYITPIINVEELRAAILENKGEKSTHWRKPLNSKELSPSAEGESRGPSRAGAFGGRFCEAPGLGSPAACN